MKAGEMVSFVPLIIKSVEVKSVKFIEVINC